MSNNLKVLRDGIIFDNPVLIQVVGMCATLATSTSIINGAGMGLSTTAVLIMLKPGRFPAFEKLHPLVYL